MNLPVQITNCYTDIGHTIYEWVLNHNGKYMRYINAGYIEYDNAIYSYYTRIKEGR